MFDREAGGETPPTPLAQAAHEERQSQVTVNVEANQEHWQESLQLSRDILETYRLHLVIAERQTQALERIGEMLELGAEKLGTIDDKLRALNTGITEIRDNLL